MFRSVPEKPDPSQSCSPITLEYAEELLLMAYDGRCSVMDVSQVPKENPSGSAAASRPRLNLINYYK